MEVRLDGKVVLVTGGTERMLTGCALVGEDSRVACVRAVLDALGDDGQGVAPDRIATLFSTRSMSAATVSSAPERGVPARLTERTRCPWRMSSSAIARPAPPVAPSTVCRIDMILVPFVV